MSGFFGSPRSLCSCLGLSVALVGLTAAEPAPAQPGITIPVAGRQLPLAPHPRLLMSAELAARLRQPAADPWAQPLVARVLAEAERILPLPTLERRMDGRRLLAVSRRCLARVSNLALAWMISGDRRYARRAIGEMQAVAAFSDWNPSHFLDVAEMTTALAVGCDWLDAELSPAERIQLHTAIRQHGLAPSLVGEPEWLRVANNWNPVCHGGMVLGALAIAEDDPALAGRVIERALACLSPALTSYAPDGAYEEGPTYWNFGTTYVILLAEGLRSALGEDFALSQAPGLLASGAYMAHVRSPNGRYFNYSDAMESAEGFFSAQVWCAVRNQSRWQLPDPVVLGSATIRESDLRFLPFGVLWARDALPVASAMPHAWVGGGRTPVALFRSGAEPTAAFVGIKGGSPATNHGHMDGGSFVYDVGGVRWISDPGMDDYGALEARGLSLWKMDQASDRWRVFRLGQQAHSLLVLNDQPQVVAGRGEIRGIDLAGPSPTAIADLTSLYRGQALTVQRRFTLHGAERLVIDDLVGGIAQAGELRWQALTKAAVEIQGSRVILRHAGQQVSLTMTGSRAGAWAAEPVDTLRRSFDAPLPGATRITWRTPVTAGDDVSTVVTIQLIP